MEQRPFGATGMTVSELGFGCGAVGGLMVRGDPDEQRRAVQLALDAGITYFDTAADYGAGQSETNLGRVMDELGTWSRVVVGTKFRLRDHELGNPRAAIRASLERSLQRMGRADVDILHLHNPLAQATAGGAGGIAADVPDVLAPDGSGIPSPVARPGSVDTTLVLGEIARGLEDVRQAGLVRHVGFTGIGETAAIHEVVVAKPYASVQTYFNALNPSAGYAGHSGGQQNFDGLIDAAAAAGVGVVVIRVLAAGAATASADRPPNAGDPGGNLVGGTSYAADLERAASLQRLATEVGLASAVELAIRFGQSKPGVSTVLVGYSSLAHLEQAIAYTERGALAPDVVARVLAL
jgi:L-galactose dehydrogenase/L-glyceraldehyde 3-phosphate reductase